jgi:DNA-binding NarL/FixJ family response regulator
MGSGLPGGLRLVIAEDSLLVREGLAKLLAGLGHQVVAVAVRAEQVMGLVARHSPDIVVMDIRMPPTFTDEGLRLAVTVRERHAGVGVVVLSQHVEPAYAGQLFGEGSQRTGYLLKDRLLDGASLDEALRLVAAGGCVVDPELVGLLMGRAVVRDPLGTLTERERDVLMLMAQGLSDRGVAERLSVSLATVATHVQSVYRKLGISDAPADNRRVSAVLAYLRTR